MSKKKKRSYKELQKLILRALRTKKLTKNQISRKTSLEWKVVRTQIILLKGHDYVETFFAHETMTIFSITKLGLKYLKKLER